MGRAPVINRPLHAALRLHHIGDSMVPVEWPETYRFAPAACFGERDSRDVTAAVCRDRIARADEYTRRRRQ